MSYHLESMVPRLFVQPSARLTTKKRKISVSLALCKGNPPVTRQHANNNWRHVPFVHRYTYTVMMILWSQGRFRTERNWNNDTNHLSVQGWGSLKFRSLITPLGKFAISQIHMLESLNHINIWQISSQLSCGDIYQIWTWHSKDNQYFDNSVELVR